jgi:hypothetical protein
MRTTRGIFGPPVTFAARLIALAFIFQYAEAVLIRSTLD